MTAPAMPHTAHSSALFLRSWQPSLRRAVASIFSVFSLPLLLLAAISAAKLMTAAGLIAPAGWFKSVIDWQSGWVDAARRILDTVRISVPSQVIDGAMFYIFVGNAVARSEADELMAVTLDEGTAWQFFKDAFREWRADYFFYSLPWGLRWLAIRLLWPVAAAYRLGTPWVVDGPGPTGEEISTSVRRRDMAGFIDQLVEAGAWDQQTLYDCRLVLGAQLLLGLASSLALHALATAWT
ncbi:MAG: hypothetical protein KGP27_04260 [Hyphomicrobiales bacterium]|nr:hypothetical protein [Hyphomicrobiales bacterium]